MSDFLERLLSHDRYVITTHIRPDGDAIGSQLALGRFLGALGKDVLLVNHDPAPDNLAWLPGTDEIFVFDGALALRERIDAATAFIIVDTNGKDRIGSVSGPLDAGTFETFLIDHHTSPETWFDVARVQDTASSTGEMIYDIIAAHDASLIDTPIAEALYTAIMTDTGSFRFNSVTPHVHRIVADLLERGDISPAPIHTALYDSRSLAGLRLLSRALDTITLAHDGQVAYMMVTLRVMRELGASSDEMEGFVSYALSVEGVKAAVIFLEISTGVKMSFRSKADTYVHEWARHFGGGGHRNASGAFAKSPLDPLVRDVIEAAPRFLDLNTGTNTGPLSGDDADYLALLKQKFHAS